MRWKISHHGHDPRHIDLLVALALVIVIIAAWRFFESGSDTLGAFDRNGSRQQCI